jgi:heme oxygenase (biliverdin-IX-beta and delta-forming)
LFVGWHTLDLARLRLETAVDHVAVEAGMPLMVEDLDQNTYIRCLLQVHGIVAAWEEWSAGSSPEWMHSLLGNRQRRGLLERDLAWFGVVHLDPARPAMPEMKDEASLLGSMYVMEGSTLGGRLIARHVERVLGLSVGVGDAYFCGHNQQTGTLWKEFCGVLQASVPDRETDTVIAAAKTMFQIFGSWMQMSAS